MAFSRWMRRVGKLSQRRLRPKPDTLLYRFFHSGVMMWDRTCTARGVAIGLFWAAIPMPLQMFPATVFCLLFRGNLPLAIACVWLSNPLTYVPLFAFEYAVGRLLLSLPDGGAKQLEELGGEGVWTTISMHFQEIGVPIFAGGLALGIVASVVGYLLTYFLWQERLKPGHRTSARHSAGAAPDKAR